MIIADVNVLIAAMSPRVAQHKVARSWLVASLRDEELFGTWEPILASVVRITTHAGFTDEPAKMEPVLEYIDSIRSAPNHVSVRPSDRLWETFEDLVKESRIVGRKVSDLLYAAVAIDQDADFYTFDSDFQRIPRVRVKRPA